MKVQLILMIEATINDPRWTTKMLTDNAVGFLEHCISEGEKRNTETTGNSGVYTLNTGEDGATLWTLKDFVADLKDGKITGESA